MESRHLIKLYFDLNTVLENDYIQALARQSGWDDNESQNSFEAWQLWSAQKNIKVAVKFMCYDNLNDSDSLFYIEGEKLPHEILEDNEKQFTVMLSMCKDEFINQLMKKCKIYSEDRYGRDALLKYMFKCQSQPYISKSNYDKLFITIPEWDEKVGITNFTTEN